MKYVPGCLWQLHSAGECRSKLSCLVIPIPVVEKLGSIFLTSLLLPQPFAYPSVYSFYSCFNMGGIKKHILIRRKNGEKAHQTKRELQEAQNPSTFRIILSLPLRASFSTVTIFPVDNNISDLLSHTQITCSSTIH